MLLPLTQMATDLVLVRKLKSSMESGLSCMQLYLSTKNMRSPVFLTANVIKPPKMVSLLIVPHLFHPVSLISSAFKHLCLATLLFAAVFNVSAGLFSCACIQTNTSLQNMITSSTISTHYSRFRVYFCLVLETCSTSSKNSPDCYLKWSVVVTSFSFNDSSPNPQQ